MKKRLIFAALFLLILDAEIILGIFVDDGFFRPYFGDVLAVVGVYFFARIFLVKKPVFLSVFAVIFAFIVELLQLTDFHRIFGSEIVSVILGGTFDSRDLLCYFIGGCACFFIDFCFIKNDKKITSKKG